MCLYKKNKNLLADCWSGGRFSEEQIKNNKSQRALWSLEIMNLYFITELQHILPPRPVTGGKLTSSATCIKIKTY